MSNKRRNFYRRPVHRTTLFQKILAYCCLVILAVTLLGTAVAFTVNPHRLSDRKKAAVVMLSSRPADPIPSPLQNQETYTLLGTLRTGTRDDPSIPLVVEPWFYYDSTDVSFYQELQQKSRKIRAVITDYFTGYTKAELQQKGEQKVKEEIKSAINQVLVLGALDAVYFNDYTFFD